MKCIMQILILKYYSYITNVHIKEIGKWDSHILTATLPSLILVLAVFILQQGGVVAVILW